MQYNKKFTSAIIRLKSVHTDDHNAVDFHFLISIKLHAFNLVFHYLLEAVQYNCIFTKVIGADIQILNKWK